MKKVTAVEWLLDTLGYNENMGGGVQEIIEQAKEMEKQQIINALLEHPSINSEQYYNETYK
jgi:hypothetical protein